MPSIITDIDHVLAHAAHRDTLLGNWEAYHAASWQDAPVKPMVTLVNTLAEAGINIVVITGRPEKWRQLTTKWLVDHDIKVDELLMRPNLNFSPQPVVKMALALARFEEKLITEVLAVFDDREDVVAVFKAVGVMAMQVHSCGS